MSTYRPINPGPIGDGPVESPSDLRTVDWWGVVFTIVVLSAFFSAIMFSWFFLRFGAESWPPVGTDQPDVVLPSIAAGLLLLSCLPLVVLQLRLKSGSRSRMNLLLAASGLLGLAFLGVQVASFLNLDFGARDHAYGSAFYTITVFVMLLAFAGLYVGAIVQARAWKGHFNGPRHVALTNLATYWYSITLMWAIVYVSIYLLPLVD
jgi:cytochrome c oxidase subunit III